ncbi:hypothetical protein LWI28_009924 [Acer negundo]|uniref:RNase H type-1 domain-containing protein n=1 Tax=Acer negundo TaxID=4023 RepID=A0AAD5NWZ6_ACENE|nr:hypothetical protein LWI28_009924 [Acer negundo]
MKSSPVLSCSSMEMLEAQACLEGLQLANDIGISGVIIKSDAAGVIQLLSDQMVPHTEMGAIIYNSLALSASVNLLSFVAIRREANSVSYCIAQIALLLDGHVVWLQEMPSITTRLVREDSSSLVVSKARVLSTYTGTCPSGIAFVLTDLLAKKDDNLAPWPICRGREVEAAVADEFSFDSILIIDCPVESAMESKDDFDMQDMNKSVEDYDFYSGGDNGDDTGPTYAFDSDDEFIDNDTDDSDDLASHRHVPLFV